MKKKLILITLAIAMLCSVTFYPGSTEPTKAGVESVRDPEALSVEKELAISREAFRTLKGNPGNKSLAMKYVPKGGVLLGTDSTDYQVYLDYTIGQTRYTVTYYWDGNVEKVTHEESSPYIYIVDGNNKKIQVIDIRSRTETFTRSEAEIETDIQARLDSGVAETTIPIMQARGV